MLLLREGFEWYLYRHAGWNRLQLVVPVRRANQTSSFY